MEKENERQKFEERREERKIQTEKTNVAAHTVFAVVLRHARRRRRSHGTGGLADIGGLSTPSFTICAAVLRHTGSHRRGGQADIREPSSPKQSVGLYHDPQEAQRKDERTS